MSVDRPSTMLHTKTETSIKANGGGRNSVLAITPLSASPEKAATLKTAPKTSERKWYGV
jgi:hypothetical protein